jgi:hypothetical protein
MNLSEKFTLVVPILPVDNLVKDGQKLYHPGRPVKPARREGAPRVFTAVVKIMVVTELTVYILLYPVAPDRLFNPRHVYGPGVVKAFVFCFA